VNYFLLPCGADLILERWVLKALRAIQTNRKDRLRYVAPYWVIRWLTLALPYQAYRVLIYYDGGCLILIGTLHSRQWVDSS